MKQNTRYPLSALGRWVMHDIHEGICWVCGQFVELRDMETDHVVPTSAREAAENQGLPVGFDVNALENLLPSHRRCNQLKSNKLLNPFTVLALARANEKAGPIRSKVAKLKASKEVAGVLATIERHIEAGQLTAGDLEVIRQALRKADEREYLSWLDPGWTNVRRVSEIHVEATGPLGSGLASIGPNRSSEYLCPACNRYGPWSGPKCCMCGYRGMPDD